MTHNSVIMTLLDIWGLVSQFLYLLMVQCPTKLGPIDHPYGKAFQ